MRPSSIKENDINRLSKVTNIPGDSSHTAGQAGPMRLQEEALLWPAPLGSLISSSLLRGISRTALVLWTASSFGGIGQTRLAVRGTLILSTVRTPP